MYKERIIALRDELAQYEYEYYILNAPTISDTEYDHLMAELRELEDAHPEMYDPNSPTQRVGSDLQSGDRAVKHRVPMLSLANTYSTDDIRDYYERTAKVVGDNMPVVAELKFDGVSISIIYTDGVFTRAVTRGDGTQGDDVSASVRAIRSVPTRLRGKDLPHIVEVRGEIVLPWGSFRRINEEREQRGLHLFANPRNAVAGTIKQLSPRVVSERKPDVLFYYLLVDEEEVDWLPHYHHERLEMMRGMGLKVSKHYKVCETQEQLIDFIDEWDVKRHELDVATDGIVVKIDDTDLYNVVGYTANSPKWAIAYKYPAEQQATRLTGVAFQVGRTGVVTPVAQLEPVHLSGTTVQRASLHNADIMAHLDIHLNDIVLVEKGGEIIPKIVGVKKDERNDGRERRVVAMPDVCPACGTKLVRHAGEAGTFCPNDTTCPPQILGGLEHFTARKAMNIKVGPETLKDLLDLHLIRDISDLYRLTVDDLLRLPGYKLKSAENLYKSIAGSKNVPFERVLFAMGIPYVGETIAALLARAFGSVERLAATTVDQLTAVNGIGTVIAQSVYNYFRDDRHITMVERLQEAGLHFSLDERGVETDLQQVFEGQSIVVSGVFSTMSRDDLKAFITARGGNVTGSISAKTAFIVAGEKMGPSKLQKAQELGVQIITEQDFFAKYGEA